MILMSYPYSSISTVARTARAIEDRGAAAHAIVINSGLAGLLAARVLVGPFTRVTLLDQAGPSAPGDHPLLLGAREQQLLYDLFPSLREDLSSGGAVPLNMGQHVEWFLLDRWRPHYHASVELLGCSVELLEERLRSYLQCDPRVTFQKVHAIDGPILNDTGDGVTALRVRPEPQYPIALSATLVIDASGRDSQTPNWFAHRHLQETPLPSGLKRGSRLYRRPADWNESWRALIVQPAPPHSPCGGMILPLDEERLHVSLLGLPEEWVATETAWLAFAAALPTPRLVEFLQRAEPLTAISVTPPQRHALYHYERLANAPQNYLAFGGSMYRLPTMQEHSITLDAVAATLLDAELQKSGTDLSGIASRFHRAVAVDLEDALQVLIEEGCQWAAVGGQGTAGPSRDSVARYLMQVRAATLMSTEVLDAWYRVQQLLDRPRTLFEPNIVLQVMRTITP